jgi:putative membrane-bound dehydrogenase-like protein
MKMRALCLAVVSAIAGSLQAADAPNGIRPAGRDGHTLNLDFETGNLADWTPEGDAFKDQPVEGDLVRARRGDMASDHTGKFWIGGYERAGDAPKGTLTSAPFKVTAPWGAFRFAGGHWPEVRVELVDDATKEVFFKTSGIDVENLRPVVVDLSAKKGRDIFIRLVDDHSGGWGHLNFDDFRLYASRPAFANELTAAEVAKLQPPPADLVPFAGLSPQDACDKATLPPGFKMKVFAGEPDIVQPIAFCLDHKGRVWVAEGLCYPHRRADKDANDQILCFEDTDGDGHFDRRTVVATNLNLVSGLEWGFGGLFIGAAPNLMFLPIDDGDAPKPAGPPQILLDGWNFTADTHEVLNTFTWGPDGWLYGCHGVFCPSNVGKPGAPESERQWVDAAVWRYHPATRAFEVFTEGGSNPWGIDFDEHGDLWAEMCVIPHLFNMVQGARLQRQGGEHYCVGKDELARIGRAGGRTGKPVNPYVYEDILTVADHLHWAGGGGPHAANGRSDAVGGGHAHAGMMVYLGSSWPAEYRGKLIIGNIHGQRFNMDVPVRKGSGWVGKHGPDFLNFNDTWSQTLNQRYDQDGSVYTIDWYDKNQCHHNRDDGHDRSNGRIYKIVYNDQPTTKVDLTKLDNAQLIEEAVGANEWRSRHARLILEERAAEASQLSPGRDVSGNDLALRLRNGGASVVPTPAMMPRFSPTNAPAARLRAIWAMHAAGQYTPTLARLAFRDTDEWIRSWALRLEFEEANLWSGEARDPRRRMAADRAIRDLVTLASQDKSQLVRRHVASALQRIPPEHRWPVLAALVAHAEDAGDQNLPFLYWSAAEGSVATEPDKAVDLIRATKIPKLREWISRRLASLSLAAN